MAKTTFPKTAKGAKISSKEKGVPKVKSGGAKAEMAMPEMPMMKFKKGGMVKKDKC
jgi:hypothetical protein